MKHVWRAFMEDIYINVKKSIILSNWCKNHLYENHGLLASAA
jgi:hypothetical protein